MAGFGINDGFMKMAFEDLPLAQSIAIRGMFATIVLAVLALHHGAFGFRPTRSDAGHLTIRTVGELGATATFLVAIANMPIAEATAVLQAAPLAVTMAAALVLGERVRWRRWSAIGVGFVGVIIMLRPGTEGFTPWSLLAALTVVFITLRDLVTRLMRTAVPNAFASTLTAFSITVVAASFIPLEGWVRPDALHVAMLGASAWFLVIGYLFSVSAMRVGDVSFVSPFRYTVLLWAMIVGFVLFGEVPDAFTFAGAALVTAAGLYTLRRERVVGAKAEAALTQSHPFSPKVDDDAPIKRP